MFGDNKKQKKEAAKGKVETIIGNGSNIEGDIETKGSLRIEGMVSGKIKADGDLFVGEEGKVNTDIEARNVIIAGNVEGNVFARSKLELLPTGKLNGDIKTKTIKIEEGAVFRGKSAPLNNTSNPENKSDKKVPNDKNKKDSN